ncbi:uncharacterized protein V1513DRAFT_441259 [Lipomyces chichibuensis]|uniref:uncharacterized protein n=1 Tax=Lipomyces chichibuensis TaxID=1546026 RepID=UPI0033440150
MSILESQRYALEDLDRLEKAIADRFLDTPRTHRDRISQEHEIVSFLDRIQHQSKFLIDSFEDAHAGRAHEIANVQGGEISQFDEFYKQLKSIKDFHRRYPNEPVENLEENYRKKRRTDDDSPDLDTIDTMFTGEEGLGKYFDLIAFHERYLNLRGVTHVPYVQYLDIFDKFEQMSRTPKDDKYFKYLTDLSGYLEGFLKRTQPLNDPEGMIAKIEENFKDEWENKLKQNGGTAENYKRSDPNADSFYCDDCEKMFEKQTVYDGHLSGKKHKKNVELKEKAVVNGTSSLAADLKAQAIALREYEIKSLVEILEKVREETKINVERKSALTLRERQLEMEALEREEFGGAEDDGEGDQEDDGKIYNPLKLPIGWDGKPIPFWLWKLHGLGVEHPCEICGNFVYMGRKAFDKHFMEARHVHGLRCLGIQNSALFREITSIQDALALWEKIKKERRAQESMREQAVEVEDDEGNVMSEKVYNDLKKQGLL